MSYKQIFNRFLTGRPIPPFSSLILSGDLLSQGYFRNEIGGMGSDNMGAQDLIGLGLGNDLYQSYLFPHGPAHTRKGLASNLGLAPITRPVIGEMIQKVALMVSMVPISSPCFTSRPASTVSRKATSPLAFLQKVADPHQGRIFH